MATKRLNAVILGRVQGVGFRAFVWRQAAQLGLTGFARNRYFPRRCVEVVAEGPEADLQQLLALVRQGPPAARVEQVEIDWQPATGEFPDFSVD